MTREQKVVAVGADSGSVSMLLALWLLPTLLPPPADAGTPAGRLAYALRWAALAAFPLALIVAAVGNARFKREAIDPTRPVEDRTMIINGRVAENTLKQFALFLAGS